MIIIIFVLWSIIDNSELYEHEGIRDLEIIAFDIERLQHAPIAINAASLADLQKIPFLTFNDCQRIINNRDVQGLFRDLDDLLRIPGFDRLLVEQMAPYISFRGKKAIYDKTTVRIRETTSFPLSQYQEEVYGRAFCYISPYTFYGLCEKDPHEKQCLDFWAAGLVAQYHTGTYAFGKYNLDLGTGIMLSPIGSFYSTTDFHLMIRERGIIPYTSVNENSGFFGGAVSDSILTRFTLFYSNQKLDGRIDTLGFARSFDVSGNHIDSASLDHKDRINEEIAGYDIKYRIGSVQVAQRSYWCRYEPSFTCTDSLYHFYGNKFFMPGAEVRYVADDAQIFAEVAQSYKKRIGGVGGFCGELPFIDVMLAARYFPNGYYSPKGVEAASGTREGIIVMKNRSRIVNIQAQVNIDGDVDNDVVEYTTKITAEKRIECIRIKVQMQWRYQEQILDLSGSRVFLRIQAHRSLWADIRLEERYVFTDSSIDQGLYGCFELGAQCGFITTRFRYGMFSTESYASRMYIYEIDLPGIVNNRMVYGEGRYGFVYCRFKASKRFSLTTKYAILWKDDTVHHTAGCQIDCTF